MIEVVAAGWHAVELAERNQKLCLIVHYLVSCALLQTSSVGRPTLADVSLVQTNPALIASDSSLNQDLPSARMGVSAIVLRVALISLYYFILLTARADR